MDAPDTIQPLRSGRLTLFIFIAVIVLPFLYLTSLAVLISAFVHGYRLPSRAFLRGYAVPSNYMVRTPGIGKLYSGYFDFCVRVVKADYDADRDANKK